MSINSIAKIYLRIIIVYNINRKVEDGLANDSCYVSVFMLPRRVEKKKI